MATWPSSLWGMEGQIEGWEEILCSRVGSGEVSDMQISLTSHIKEAVAEPVQGCYNCRRLKCKIWALCRTVGQMLAVNIHKVGCGSDVLIWSWVWVAAWCGTDWSGLWSWTCFYSGCKYLLYSGTQLHGFVCVHVCHLKQACVLQCLSSWSHVCAFAFELHSLQAEDISHGRPVDVFSGLRGAAKILLQTL